MRQTKIKPALYLVLATVTETLPRFGFVVLVDDTKRQWTVLRDIHGPHVRTAKVGQRFALTVEDQNDLPCIRRCEPVRETRRTATVDHSTSADPRSGPTAGSSADATANPTTDPTADPAADPTAANWKRQPVSAT